jgi:BioD-like phosphotransacetylase family protein
MSNDSNEASVQSVVRRLLANDQLRKVYGVDEDTLWECLRVLARMVRDRTIDADEALKAEAERSRPRSVGDHLFEAAMRDFERDGIR